MNENKEELMKWAAAAATSHAAALLDLPATIADVGRPVLETVAAAELGIVGPEDLGDEELEERVEQALDKLQKSAKEVWQELHPKGKQRDLIAEARDLHGLWCDVDPLAPEEIPWADGDQIQLHAYRWRPLFDPADPLFDPRLELRLDERMIESIGAQGVLVPVLVTLDDDRRLVVIDGLQRWRSVLELNRRNLAKSAHGALIRRIPARVVLHEGVFPAIGAANELRQEQDVMTKAIRLDALQRGGGMSVERAAAHLGLGRRMATYYLALLKLAPALQRKARAGELAFNLARVLCQVDDHELQRRAFDATKAVGAGEAIVGLRAVLADDERLCPALRAGANLSRPHDAKPGDITTCGITGEWILVEKNSATIEREAGPVYVAPGAEEPTPTKPLERLRRVIASRSGGTERDRRLLAAVVAMHEGADVDEEFAWLLGEQPKAGRRKRAAKALPEAERQLDVEAYAAEKSAGELVGEHLARHDLIHVDRPLEEFIADIGGADWEAVDDCEINGLKAVIRKRGGEYRFEVYDGGNLRFWRAGLSSADAAKEAAETWCDAGWVVVSEGDTWEGEILLAVSERDDEFRFEVLDAGTRVYGCSGFKSQEEAEKAADDWGDTHRVVGTYILEARGGAPEFWVEITDWTRPAAGPCHQTAVFASLEHAFGDARAWCASDAPGVTVRRAGEELRAELAKAEAAKGKKGKKGKKAAPPREASKRTINTRTVDGRERYDASIRQVLAGAKAPMKLAAVCSKAGGTQLQARASLARLINAGAVTWQGKGSSTTYSAINTEAVS